MRIYISIFPLLIISVTLQAAEWNLSGSAHPTLRYDDNELMQDTKDGDFSLSIKPTVNLSRNTELSSSQLNIGYDVKRYDELRDLDRQDPFARFSSNYRTERSAYGVTMAYSERESRSFADEDTGNFSSTSTITSKSLSPSFSYQLNELDSASVNFSYSETSSDALNGSDTETYNTNLAWQHKITERLSSGVSLLYANTQSESVSVDSEYDSYSISLTSTYSYSELWSFNGALGVRYLDSTVVPLSGSVIKDSSQGETYSLSATRNGETSSLSIAFSLALSPTTTGSVNEQNFYTLTYNRSLTETLQLSVYGSYREFSSPDNDSNKTKYTELSPNLNWNIDDKLSLNIGYRYRTNESNNSAQVESNAVFTTLTYDWDGYRLSR